MRNIIDVLQKRGFIESITGEGLKDFANQPLKLYCGFDPTSDSLHLGNFVALMGLAWFKKFGHSPLAVAGGATGMIGDPSGKKTERQLLDAVTIEKNLEGIRKNIDRILGGQVLILNNFDWFSKFSFLEFLRDVGKQFRMGQMLAKDSVKTRLQSNEGLSFTEFSYQVLQGYDFLYLFDQHGVCLQVGGSDQWGNITAGTELIRKMRGQQNVYGLTFPLLTTADGQKFGKSQKGAIWLSSEKLSAYEFYQYLYRVSDQDVIRLLKLLTFLDIEDIDALENKMKSADYIPNTAQKILAQEVTALVHGNHGLSEALRVTDAAAPGANTSLDPELLRQIAKEMPNIELEKERVIGHQLLEVMVLSGALSSKGEARRFIRNGGVYLNNQKIQDENTVISQDLLIGEEMILLSLGKKNKFLIRLI